MASLTHVIRFFDAVRLTLHYIWHRTLQFISTQDFHYNDFHYNDFHYKLRDKAQRRSA